MITFEIEGKDYQMPERWEEVNLEMFRKIQRHSTGLNKYKSKTQFALEMTSILLGDAPIKDLMRLDTESYELLSDKCEWVNSKMVGSGRREFKIGDELYLPIKDLKKLTMGDQISLELIINESDEIDLLPNMLPMLIRKAKKVIKEGKEEVVPGDFDSDNYDMTRDLFLKNIMICDVIDLQNFFLNSEKRSFTTTRVSSEKGKRRKTTKKIM